MNGMIGRKLGMTRIFDQEGRHVPVTVIEAGPCVVTQVKTAAGADKYDAVQLGFGPLKPKNAPRPQKGHFEKAGLPPCRVLREFRVAEGSEVKVGDKVGVDLFAAGDTLTICGTSRGKGFQGVIKRHNFRGGAATHGSMFHRAPGSIGASAFPSRVIPGMKGAGHMGSERVTLHRVKVVRVDAGNNLLIVRGSVPGAGGSIVLIRKS